MIVSGGDATGGAVGLWARSLVIRSSFLPDVSRPASVRRVFRSATRSFLRESVVWGSLIILLLVVG